jgi:NAD(P) transhydrogenase subunit alpha
VIGAILATGSNVSTVSSVFGFLAVVLATINVVGGFMVTNRMLAMFKPKK